MGDRIQYLLATIAGLDRGVAQAESALQAIKKTRAENHRELVQALKDGGTTGNRMQDYVILTCEQPNQERLAEYQKINRMLASHEGQLVLVYFTREHRMERVLGRLDDFSILYYVSLGVLRGPTLSFTTGENDLNCTLPTVSHARESVSGSLEFIDEPLGEYGFRLYKKDRLPFVLYAEETWIFDANKLNLIIGDKAVLAWCEQYRPFFAEISDTVKRTHLLERLGKLTLTSPEEVSATE